MFQGREAEGFGVMASERLQNVMHTRERYSCHAKLPKVHALLHAENEREHVVTTSMFN